jgi:hypothetical protein
MDRRMTDGRVIARGSGDTESGTFTCVVRRTSLLRRLRYQISFENNNDSAAAIVVSRGGAELQTMGVPSRSRVDLAVLLAADCVALPIVVDIQCGSTTMRLVEARPVPEDATPMRRYVVLAACAAAITALSLVATAVLIRQIWFWRKPAVPHVQDLPDVPQVDEEPPVSAGAPLAVAHHHIEPEPEILWPRQEPPAGVTYGARTVQRRRVPLALLAVVLTAALLGGGFLFAHPHVGELGAPNDVLQGSAIDVPYSSSGWGRLDYRVTSSTGTIVAGGDLDRQAGTLHIAIPAGLHDEGYRIRLSLSGPLGDASNEATISARAVPQARVITRTEVVPVIRSFAVTRGATPSAPSIVAFYDVSADSGSVRLVDSRGIQYGVVALNPSGQARFALPGGVDPGTLAVELHAVRSGAGADSRIALPSGSGGIAASTSTRAGGRNRDGDATPIVVPAMSVGVGPIQVRIVHHYADLHLALIDGQAHKIVGVIVRPGAHGVALAHPSVSVATRLTVEATYRVNNESDMVIRPVILVPSRGG